MLRASIRLVSTEAEIRQKALSAIAKEANRRFRMKGGGARLRSNVKVSLRNHLINSPTVQDLMTPGSTLQRGLGLTDISGVQYSSPVNRVERIIDVLVDGVKAGFFPFSAAGGKIHGSIQIWGVPYDHNDVLTIEEALQATTLGPEFQTVSFPPYIEWLRWLLEYGSQIVITTHFVWDTAPTSILDKFSRTGSAIMVKGARGYMIPPEHQGQFGDNFITKAVDGVISNDIPTFLKGIF